MPPWYDSESSPRFWWIMNDSERSEGHGQWQFVNHARSAHVSSGGELFLLCSFPTTCYNLLPSFCRLSLPFHVPSGNWKADGRAALGADPVRGVWMGFWCRRPLDGAFWRDNGDAEQTTSANAAGAGAGHWAGWSPTSRQRDEVEPSSEMVLIKRCFFPPAYASLHQEASKKTGTGLIIPGALILLCVFAKCSVTATKFLLFLGASREMAVVVLVQHRLASYILCTVWFLQFHKICLLNTCFSPLNKKNFSALFSFKHFWENIFLTCKHISTNFRKKKPGFIFLWMIAK